MTERWHQPSSNAARDSRPRAAGTRNAQCGRSRCSKDHLRVRAKGGKRNESGVMRRIPVFFYRGHTNRIPEIRHDTGCAIC